MKDKAIKVWKWIEKQSVSPWTAIALNVLAIVVWLLLMSPAYETNDDVSIREFVNGCRKVSDPHLVYQNICLGFLYKFFYAVTVHVPWYEIIQYITILASFTAVTFVVFRRLNTGRAFVIFFLMQLFFGFELYVRPQYTKTAGLAAAAGIFLMFYAVEQVKFRKAAAAGIILTCIGFMYRQTEAVACIALLFVLGLAFISERWKKRKELIEEFRRCLMCFGTLAGCFIVLFLVDFASYELNPEWKTYKEFNALRTELLDYGFPDYGANIQTYEELGINEDAFELYSSWNFNDPDKFTIDVMEELISLKEPRQFSVNTVSSFMKTFPGIAKSSYTFYAAVAILILWVLWGRYNRRSIICLLLEAVIWSLIYLYFFYIGRFGINRVDSGLWFSVFLTVVYFMRQRGESESKKIKYVLTAAGIVLCGILFFETREVWKPWLKMYHQQDEDFRLANREVLETLGRDQDTLYLIKGGTLSEINCYGVFDTMPENILNNICWLSGWDCNCSGQRQVLEDFNVENPFADIIDRNDVIIADNNIELTLRYIRAYYQDTAQAEHVETIGNVNLYRIVSG